MKTRYTGNCDDYIACALLAYHNVGAGGVSVNKHTLTNNTKRVDQILYRSMRRCGHVAPIILNRG